MNLEIHVIHHHVDQILFVKNVMVLVLVLVYLTILVILTVDVDQNVLQIMIVHVIKHVQIINARILVLVFVVWMLNVALSIIHQAVVV